MRSRALPRGVERRFEEAFRIGLSGPYGQEGSLSGVGFQNDLSAVLVFRPQGGPSGGLHVVGRYGPVGFGRRGRSLCGGTFHPGFRFGQSLPVFRFKEIEY